MKIIIKNNLIKSIAIFAVFALLISLSFTPTTYAVGPITSLVVLVNHTNDGLIAGLDKQQYGYMANFPGVQFVRVDVSNVRDREEGLRMINAAVAPYAEAAAATLVFAGHGVTNGLGTDSIFSKADQVWMASQVLEQNQLVGTTILDSCGSGTVFCLYNVESIMGGGLYNGAVLSSSAAYQLGYAPDMGNRITNAVSNGGADKDGDGVITVGELIDYLKANGKYNNKAELILNHDTPMFFRDEKAKDEWIKKNRGYCGVVTPGQSTGYQNPGMLGNTGVYPRGEQNKADDNHKIEESDINKKLRDARMHFLRKVDTTDAIKDPTYGKTQKATADAGSSYDLMVENQKMKPEEKEKITWLNDTGKIDGMITEAQAQESLASGVAGRHAYTVNGKKVQPFIYLKRSIVMDLDNKPIIITPDCQFKSPDPNRGKPNNQGANNDGNNGGGNNGGGNNGQGGNQQGNQNNPSPSPTPNPTPSPAVATCPNTYAPVCDINSQTQPNACVAQTQKRVQIAYNGACVKKTEDPTSSPDVTVLVKIIQQLFQSGMPQNVIESVVKIIAPLITNFFSSQTNTTVVN
ncbi:MAG: Kazal-type serine protease inhibitor [bacterium]|nr:Kazal-type serine protease inhibitor [bacterium]